MTTDDKIRDGKLQYGINREAYQYYHQVKLININISQEKKYYLPIEVKKQKRANLPNFENIFLQSHLNDLIIDKLKEIIQL